MRHASPVTHATPTRRSARSPVGLVLPWALALGCASDGDKGPQPAFGECADVTDCLTGLTCVKAGPVANHCSHLCAMDTDCTALLGAGYICSDRNACTPVCGFLSDDGCTSTTTTFASCGNGLSCRGFNADRCVSLCAVPEWGTEVRTPGLAPSPVQDAGPAAGNDAGARDAGTKR